MPRRKRTAVYSGDSTGLCQFDGPGDDWNMLAKDRPVDSRKYYHRKRASRNCLLILQVFIARYEGLKALGSE